MAYILCMDEGVLGHNMCMAEPIDVAANIDKLISASDDIIIKVQNGNLKRSKNYHGRLSSECEQEILATPDAVYVTNNGRQNFVYRKGDNVVIVESRGSSKGNIITSYGPNGPRGESGAAIFGGSPLDPGMPVTHEDIISGIKQPGGDSFHLQRRLNR